MILKEWKNGRRIVCYLVKEAGLFIVRTGKPSDSECISWRYTNREDAEATGEEFLNNWNRRV